MNFTTRLWWFYDRYLLDTVLHLLGNFVLRNFDSIKFHGVFIDKEQTDIELRNNICFVLL